MDILSALLAFLREETIMSTMASQIISLTIVYSTIYSGADERKHQSSASLAFVRGIHWWPVNSLHKGPITLKMFPFDDVIMFINAGSMSMLRGHYVFRKNPINTYRGTCTSLPSILELLDKDQTLVPSPLAHTRFVLGRQKIWASRSGSSTRYWQSLVKEGRRWFVVASVPNWRIRHRYTLLYKIIWHP